MEAGIDIQKVPECHNPGSSLKSPLRAALLSTRVVERFQCPKIPPGGRQAVLQKLSAALAGSLEELYVTS